MKIQILGAHNCESEKTKLVGLLVDGVLAIEAGALTSSLSYPAQQKLEGILITHQHFDHIKDVPLIAMNAFLHETTINIYSIPAVYDVLATHLLNDRLYPDFFKKPAEQPTIRFTVMEPHQIETVDGYSIVAVPMNHSVSTVGYQITSPDGKVVFYTGDTGSSLDECWQYVSPQLLIIEVTAPNRYEEFALRTGHFTPSLLEQEMNRFRELKGYLPQVITVHMNPWEEKEIETEIAGVARALNTPITLGHEGMLLDL